MRELLKRPIAFHPVLARLFGGINEAILWQQVFYWSERCQDKEGWVYKTKEEFERETTLTRRQQDTARENLERDGYLKTELRKVCNAPTLHYQCQVGLVQKRLLEKAESAESIEKAEMHLSSIQRVPESTTGAEDRAGVPEPLRAVKDPEHMSVAEWRRQERESKPPAFDPKPCFRIFADPIPKNWFDNRSQRAAAQNLVTEHGLEKVKKAFAFYQAHKHLEFSYDCSTPWDMDTKWRKLQAFRDKMR